MVNIQLIYRIIMVLIIALAIFWVFQTQKNRYSCTEDGCKMTPFGKFQSLKSCDNTCNKKNKNTSTENSNIPLEDNSNLNTNTKIPSEDIEKNNVNIHTTESDSDVKHQDTTSKVNIPDNNNIIDMYSNYNNIQEQIKNKKNHNPHFATTKQAKSVITDYDTFPYPRYFRGKPGSTLPIVAEREAGWRPRHDDAYKTKVELKLTPDCVMGSPSTNLLKIYKEELYHCYDNNGNIIKDYTCNSDDNCYDNDPSQCTSVGDNISSQ